MNEPTHDWADDDTFWEGVTGLMFDRDRVDKAVDEVDMIERLVDLDDRRRVLDLCCGVGRHSIEFASRGHEVVAVDRTAHYLRLADEAAHERGAHVELLQADARSFTCRPHADVALNLWTSFGYFQRHEDNLALLRSASRSLRPGGTFLLQTRAKETLAASMASTSWWERDGKLYLEERDIVDDWQRMEGRWIVVDEEGRHDYAWSGWLYSADQICDMLELVGFSRVRLFGGLDGSPFGLNARHLVAQAEK